MKLQYFRYIFSLLFLIFGSHCAFAKDYTRIDLQVTNNIHNSQQNLYTIHIAVIKNKGIKGGTYSIAGDNPIPSSNIGNPTTISFFESSRGSGMGTTASGIVIFTLYENNQPTVNSCTLHYRSFGGQYPNVHWRTELESTNGNLKCDVENGNGQRPALYIDLN